MDIRDTLKIEDGKESLKFRNEIKYICSEAELTILDMRLKALCKKDSHVGENGIYRIRSAYFDDRFNSCYGENEDGVDKREKFRVRIYNADESRITLECKFKERAMTRKESTRITLDMWKSMVDGTFKIPEDRKDDKLLCKFFLRYEKDMLRPVIIMAYERTPFVYSAGNVRITFDRNIGYSKNVAGLFDAYLPLVPIMEKGQHVLEVKYDELLPEFLYSSMNLRGLKRETYSKYYLCRKYSAQ